MGITEGRGQVEGLVPGTQPGHRPHCRDLEGLVGGQGRQQSWQPAGQHRLAAPGRTDHQHVVAPGRRDLERPAGQRLAADVDHVGHVRGHRHRRRRVRGRVLPARQDLDRLAQAVDPDDCDPVDQRRLGRDRGGDHHAASAMVTCGRHDRERAGGRSHAAVQA